MNTDQKSLFLVGGDSSLEPDRAVPDGEFMLPGTQYFRVYWNPESSAPYCWSFDFGDAETEHYIRGFETQVALKSNQTDEEEPWPNPSGWLEGEGHLVLRDGVLHIQKVPSQELWRVA